jgi:hypothetical protein
MATLENTQPELHASNKASKPYGPDTQVLVIGVHGTVNGPDNVRNITNMVGNKLNDNYNGNVVIDSSFAWDANAANNGNTRGVAAGQLTRHTMRTLEEAYRSGALDRDKPLVIQYVGFSHGGNVALQAADDTSEALKNQAKSRGQPLNAAIHVATLSTPVYQGESANRGVPGEDPRFAAARVNEDGVRFAHSHVYTRGDAVSTTTISGGHRDGVYLELGNGGVTRNLVLPQFNGNFIDNHGAAQDRNEHMRRASDFIDSRHRGLAPSNNSRIADVGGQGDLQIAALPKDLSNHNLPNDLALSLGIQDRSNGRGMLDTIESRYFRIGDKEVQNPHADHFASLMKDLQTPNFGLDKQKDNAAAVVEAMIDAKFKPNQEVEAFFGNKDNLIAVQGIGDSANRVSVDIKSTDGAFERVSNTLFSQTQQQSQSQVAVMPSQETEQRRQASPSLA